MKTVERQCDLMIIGSGMAGMAAAIFASGRGLSTALIGNTGNMRFFSGLIDLMSVSPIAPATVWSNPWKGIERLAADQAHPHPYARLRQDMIHAAMDVFLATLSESGLVYHTAADRNQTVITSMGTGKTTYGVPETMTAGVRAFQEKAPCLIVGFPELKGFSSRQIRETIGRQWPALKAVDLPFPGNFHELFPEQMAAELEGAQCRNRLAECLMPYCEGVQSIGLPAVLGIRNSREVHHDLETRTGLPVFEIPTLPPSIPGLRLKNALEQELVRRGVQVFFQQRAERVDSPDAGVFLISIGEGTDQIQVRAKGVLLATGRFFSRGLVAERTGIREPLFGLPVSQPGSRSCWHNPDFFSESGHAINLAGLEIDDGFRPLDQAGQPVNSCLFAAGSILANQDWMRMKCGSGLSIATAYAAVTEFVKQVKNRYV